NERSPSEAGVSRPLPATPANPPSRSLPSRKLPSRKLPMRQLGRTSLSVSAIGFGSAPLGDLYAKLDEEAAIAAVKAAVADGVTLFDTSPHYGNGLAEHRVGAGLRGLARDAYVLST